MMLMLLIAGTHAVMASDWVLAEDKYSAKGYSDHLYFEVFLADLDGKNTYCKEGTLIATNGSVSIELLTLQYINQGDGDNQTGEVKARLLQPNAKAYFTNSSPMWEELTTSEQNFWIYKWGTGRSTNHYLTADIDFYHPAVMADGTWKIYFHFKHSNGDWYSRTLSSSVWTDKTLGLPYYSFDTYQIERTGCDRLTFTVPALQDDIDSDLRDLRMRKATYNVQYTFHKEDGTTATVSKTYEAGSSEKTEDCAFPDSVGNPTSIDYKVTVTHGIKDPDAWFYSETKTFTKPDAFPVIPVPGTVTTDYHQFDHQTVLAWTSPVSSRYTEVTPYIYRIETDADGRVKSGRSWSQRGKLAANNGGAMFFTDDDVAVGTYYKYMVVNVPTAYINNGISGSSLNSPSDDLLSNLGTSTSSVLNTAPSVTLYGLQQDTTIRDKVRLIWHYTRVPSTDATATFKVLRSTSETGSWSEYATVSGDANPAAGAALTFEDTNLPNSVARYRYKVRLEMPGGYRFETGEIKAGFLEGASLQSFDAAKGTYDASVTLTWRSKVPGTANCNYVISRRYINTNDEFMQVYTGNGADANYSYEDRTVLPGYYYEYRLELFEAGILQSTLYTVGFCQSRGTVSGRVNFGTGSAVPDVRLWLRPSDTGDDNTVKGSSQYVHGLSEGIAWQAEPSETEQIFGADKDYTVQFFVRPDKGLNEGAVLANIPGCGQLLMGSQTDSGYGLKMFFWGEHITDLATITGDYEAQDKEVLTGTLGGYYKISIADGATVVLRNVTIKGSYNSLHNWAGINCRGNATLVLEGNNTIEVYNSVPGIHITGSNKTLTIKGTGSLTVSSQDGAAIGSGYMWDGGNIVIEGGTITTMSNGPGIGAGPYGGCEDITITGGIIETHFHYESNNAPGIGSGYLGTCGNITIANTVTSVSVVRARNSNPCIGPGLQSVAGLQPTSGQQTKCASVNIGGTVYWDGSNYQNGGDTILQKETYTYTGDGSWASTYVPVDVSYPVILSTGLTLPADKYSLLTLSKSGNQLSLQVNNGEVKTIGNKFRPVTAPFSLGGMQGITAEQAFKGNFAEVRVFNHVLSEAEKASYFDRTLNGRESGLVLYWPLDEGLERYAFDASYSSDRPNSRHATVGNNIVPSSIVPAAVQLARYGVTNEKGEYLIRDIPFLGSGSAYTLVPEKGIHRFNPNNRALFISPASLAVNNVDFEDESSFPMTGHIYYAGTNIPAEGILLYVDGIISSADGKMQQTDADGYYSISVPIGEHYVEAKLDGHTLVDNGRFPIEGTYNFVDRVQHDFSDSTLVNFVGRVAGAAYNDSLPVGFGESKNNIGTATITLKLNNESFSFNCKDDYITPAENDRNYESDTAAIQSRAWTGHGVSESKYIYITTDSATGEFSAKLPPFKYVMKSVTIDKNPEVEFTSLQEVDLTNPLQMFTDSIIRVNEQGDTVTNGYRYHTKKVLTWYAQPQVDVREKGHPAGAFGLDSVIATIDEAHGDTILRNLYTIDSLGVHNRFGYPVYQMGDDATYYIHAYEAYTNYDGKKPLTDTVHLSGLDLTIGNEMSGEQSVVYKVPVDTGRWKPGDVYEMKYNTITLDKNGEAELRWSVGFPNIVSPFTRQFNVTLKRDNRTYEPFRMDAIVLGSLTMGNNFVTKGPDKLLSILRDPYGAHSKTTLKKGKVITKTKYDNIVLLGEHSANVDFFGGLDITTLTGEGVLVFNRSKAQVSLSPGLKINWKVNIKRDSIYQETTIETVSTSDKSPYVGPNGDVFIGQATNLLIGPCRKVHVRKDVQTQKYAIVLDEALTMGDSVTTTFAYSQYDLETVMIPKWKDMRGKFLTQVATETEARAYVNTGEHNKYLTWLTPDHPDYGKDTSTYVLAYPKERQKEDEVDSVQWCNNQIYQWTKYLEQNEKAKINAIRNTKKDDMENYSIDGGSNRVFTYRHDSTKLDRSQLEWNLRGVGGWQKSWELANLGEFGFMFKTTHEFGGGTIKGSGDDFEEYTEWEYVLSDGNRDVDLSINMYPSENGYNSKIFSLFGGQTYNPYEPADSTHYYLENGQKLPLGNGSVQMEQPYIRIGKGDEQPARSVTLTDIPAGRTATATLYCTNMANVHQGVNFSYNLGIIERSNPYGLEILMDGTPVNGRSVYLNQSETTQKLITVRQTDESILDYDSVEIWFMSQYQPASIYDRVWLSAHFRPSSSPVDLTAVNPVINTDPTTGNGKLQLKVSGFNRQFKNLKNIGVQYRFAGNTQWTTLHTWVTNRADSVSKDYSLLPATGDLRLTVDMSDNISYPEGDYEFRAFTTTPYDNEPVQVFSEVVPVVKDMILPRPLFTPSPANGILGTGEQLAVEFNEDIVPGYVGDKNIIVTARLNGRPIDHEVSFHIVPFEKESRTINPVFLNGNFSLEFWCNYKESGTLIHQGAGNSKFSLSIDENGHVVVGIAGGRITSTDTLPKNKWIFIALNYYSQSMTFSMIAQYDEVTVQLFTLESVEGMNLQMANYAADNYLYLGPVDARIHDLALYNTCRDVLEAAGDKYVSKNAYTYGLTNYWPMNEGHGRVASDTRHTHDFIAETDYWDIENTNYALRIDTVTGAQTNISLINTGRNDSYAIELWYYPAWPKRDTIFETANIRLRLDSLTNIVLDYGTKSQMVAVTKDISGWHHMALNVVRGQAASFYLDGKRTAVITEADMPGISGATLVVGKGAPFSFIDELRIWKATLSEERLLSNMYNTMDTADVYSCGLVAYYPFEKDSTINGIKTKGQTLQNMAPQSKTGNAGTMEVDGRVSADFAPPLKNAVSETRITAVPVASERKVVINLSEAEVRLRDIEGTTLNVTLAEVHDLHGNISNPIKWTAYVRQNTLLWTKDSVNIAKKYGDNYTFDVDITNKSGQTEYYTVENMPEWLRLVASYTSDNVLPLNTKTLRFEVNPLVPVGDYDVTIGLKGRNEILEPLRIVMKVRGETPEWHVDPTKYIHSMTVIGQVYLGGILMENPESMVAAFIDGECRGVAYPQNVRSAPYVTLQVYGEDAANADSGKQLSFRIWDATRGVAYTDARIAVDGKDSTLVFHQDKIVGNFDSPVIWTKSDRVEQLIPVHENWNWIAFGVEPSSVYCDDVLAQYKGWNVLVKDRETFSQSSGSIYNGTLRLGINRMYKMRIQRAPKTGNAALDPLLSVSGRQPAPEEIPATIAPGWNWLPYTPLTTKRVAVALAGVQPQIGDIIKSQTEVAIYGAYGWGGTLQSLEAGHGYLYYSTDSLTKSFIYPEDLYQPDNRFMAMNRSHRANIFSPVDGHTYPNNMTMTIRLMDGDAVVDTCELAAFVGDECRGAVRATDGLYYLVISGEDAGTVAIRTVLNGEVVTLDESVTFTSDAHIGTPWEPYVIHLNAPEGIEGTVVNPQSSGRKLLIDGILYLVHPDGKVYNVQGARVNH